ncbi:hypothetical protein [Nostoc sp. FACHB-110]|nr:hypothetical protein [Nostoc sp. FACHB-110]MBD2437282.1 hypothetical protein [Nostoc sp. FACHB-110]
MMQWILPITFILAGLLAGLICEKFLFPKIKKFTVQKHIPGTRIIFQALL